jgi:hypothetical protein
MLYGIVSFYKFLFKKIPLMEKYPVIKIPNGLINPNLKGEEPKEPQEPKTPSKPKESGVLIPLIIFLFAFLIMVFLSTSSGGTTIGFVLGIIVFFVMVFGCQISKDKEKDIYNEQIKEYAQAFIEYEMKYSQYIHKRGDHKFHQIQLSNDTDYRRELFKEKQFEYLKNALKPEKALESVTEGVSEDFFYDYLKTESGSKIHNNLILPNLSGGRHYYPDFVYWDINSNLLIDIEIDEPYKGNDGNPIHYSSSDDERNRIFIRNRWIVIRFSERQVIEYPKQCCNVIRSLTSTIFEENKLKISSLSEDNKWSYFEAQEMANKNYRNVYLPNNLRLKVNKENFTNDHSDEFNDDLPF